MAELVWRYIGGRVQACVDENGKVRGEVECGWLRNTWTATCAGQDLGEFIGEECAKSAVVRGLASQHRSVE